MKSNLWLLASIVGLLGLLGCPPPAPDNLCGRRSQAGGQVLDGKECPAEFTCVFEPAPTSSDDTEWGVCKKLSPDAGTPDAFISTDGPIADGGRDASLPDQGTADTWVEDAAGACSTDPCSGEANTRCQEGVDGGFVWTCNGAACGASEQCAVDEQSDGGTAVLCCTSGEHNCGGACVDTGSSASHCGGCGLSCENGQSCIGGQCSCAVGSDGGGGCPAGEGAHAPGVSCVAEDAGPLGRCVYTCPAGWGDCDSSPNTCETDLNTDPGNCGACGEPARVTTTINNVVVLLSNRCEGGAPVCGGSGSACAATIGGTECYEPGGEGDSSATCEKCISNEAPLCGAGMCCQGLCVNADNSTKDSHCGCDPTPGSSNAGTDCTSFDLSSDTIGGKVCVNNSGARVTRAGLAGGSCGCTQDGADDCNSVSYSSGGQGTGVDLVGLCGSNHRCVTQSVSACGVLGGVVSASGGVIHSASCNPLYGGQVCEDNQGSDGLGECGCGTWDVTGGIDKGTSCQAPVLGSDGRGHVVASTCTTGACICFNSSGSSSICDPNSASSDCCEGDGCVDLVSNASNCGVCGASCGSGDSCSAGQCGCGSSGSCPLNGGGGGPTCVGNVCACAQNNNAACPAGTWCMGGIASNGVGNGCCDSNASTGPNRCKRSPNNCPDDNPVLCVNDQVSGTKNKCCPAGSVCGDNGTDVLCN